jgi:hypothetical protein
MNSLGFVKHVAAATAPATAALTELISANPTAT